MKYITNFFKNTDIKQEWNPEVNINNNYPKEWLDIHFKTYPRFQKIRIDKPKIFNTIERVIAKRRSFREYNKDYKITKKQLDSIFSSLNNIRNKDGNALTSRRNYPSAGARFPIEQYLIIFNCKDYSPGLYHINIYENTLEVISLGNYKKFFKNICNSKWVGNASALLILSCVPERTTIKYGQRGLRYVLFEIGHIAQNFMLLAQSRSLRTCAIGGFDDKELKRFLKCEKVNEYPLYLITIGK